jgi:hypothetical protein
MASINGLTRVSATSIQNAGQIYLGNSLDSGTPGQVIISNGPQQAVSWGSNSATLPGALTAGTNLSLASGNASFDGTVADTLNASALTITGGKGISVVAGTEILTDNDNTTINNSGGTGNQNQVLKVPNALVKGTNITFSSGTTYDGSAAITIGATNTDTTYQGSSTINIDTSTNPDTINTLKVPNVMTASTNIIFTNTDDGAAETSYDGSQPITIRATDTNTEYTAGTNLNLAGTTFNLDTSITTQTGITFLNSGASTNLTGSNYPNTPTIATNLDLSSATNITSPFFFVDVYDPSTADADSLSTSYTAIFSSNLSNTFVAKATSCIISLQVFNYSISGSRWLYLQLGDSAGSEWSQGTKGGGYGTGTRDTARNIHFSDETDKQLEVVEWYLQGLTVGSSYTINPMAKTSSTLNYIYAGGSYPASILKGYYLPS